MNLSRRSLLKLSAAGVMMPDSGFGAAEYRFHHDHVMGTSLDLLVFATSESDALAAETAVLSEIARLSRLLSTYDPRSEISRLGHSSANPSPELCAVFSAYETWNRRTHGAIALRTRGAVNVNALGKPFIAAKAVEAARIAVPGILGIMLDAGGDVVISGKTSASSQNKAEEPWVIGVADPDSPHDNASPLTTLNITEGAVATSGTTARGSHIIDPRTGLPATSILSATVLAPDAITANALSMAVCVLGPQQGLQLVERTPGAECLVVSADGSQFRSSGFGRYERPLVRPALAEASWPDGFEVVIDMNLKDAGTRRPYVAVWVEDMSKHSVRNLLICYRKPRYLNELHAWFGVNSNNPNWAAVSRPTPAPGHYTLRWDGLDDKHRPVPQGIYKVFIETAREHSYYEKESAQIACMEAPAAAVTKNTPEFDPVQVTYGPKKRAA